MKEKLSYTYEEALEEEKELEGKIRDELDSLGKPELMAVVKDYAVVVAMRLTIGTFEGK
uniref:Uncharacterized protein n=1 Tax=Siphoviridae sp. ctZ1O5 TaxID=2825555 RepID=A0A8S5PDK2_9CAUD|nr:MAG TPA: hypothetical protein [Siphoviridae sp. ctZ1O5]